MPRRNQTTAQSAQVAQFMELTGCSEHTAATYLVNSRFNLQEAINEYFNKKPVSAATSSHPKPPRSPQSFLKQTFRSFLSPSDDTKTLDIESSMKYITSLGASIEDASMFIVLEVVQAPSIGVITEEGFVEGWLRTGLNPSISEHKLYIENCTKALGHDATLFRKIYRYAFVVGKEPSQKALSLENALIYWSILFAPPGWSWQTQNVNWLEQWSEYLTENWKRTVNRDMWNQLLEFAFRSIADETLSFWSEDGAWPSVIDDFVLWFRQKTV